MALHSFVPHFFVHPSDAKGFPCQSFHAFVCWTVAVAWCVCVCLCLCARLPQGEPVQYGARCDNTGGGERQRRRSISRRTTRSGLIAHTRVLITRHTTATQAHAPTHNHTRTSSLLRQHRRPTHAPSNLQRSKTWHVFSHSTLLLPYQEHATRVTGSEIDKVFACLFFVSF
jgi:hypothetical protein